MKRSKTDLGLVHTETPAAACSATSNERTIPRDLSRHFKNPLAGLASKEQEVCPSAPQNCSTESLRSFHDLNENSDWCHCCFLNYNSEAEKQKVKKHILKKPKLASIEPKFKTIRSIHMYLCFCPVRFQTLILYKMRFFIYLKFDNSKVINQFKMICIVLMLNITPY